MKTVSHWQVFWQLLKTDLITLHKGFLENVINATIWAGTIPLISTFFLTAPLIATNFGVFQAVGTIVSIAGYNLYVRVTAFLGDQDGDKFFMCQLGLPLPGWLLCVKMIVITTINGMLLGCIATVITKLLLWDTFDMRAVHAPKALLAFLLSNVFFGCFTLFIMSVTKNLLTFRNTWVRILYPLWFLGGIQFTWHSLYIKNHLLSYAALLNPYLYAQEGLRGAMLSTDEYLNFWFCMGALVVFSAIFGIVAIRTLKKRFDFV